MDLMTVTHKDNFTFNLQIRDHLVDTDMHKDEEGDDRGMNPAELFVGALGACMAMTLRFYCRHHKISSDGISVNVVPTLDANPKRIKSIAIDINLPEGFPKERRKSIINIAKKCPLHNTLENPPEVDIEVV